MEPATLEKAVQVGGMIGRWSNTRKKHHGRKENLETPYDQAKNWSLANSII